MNAPLIKICGITNHDDAECAVEQGVDFLGFCFVHSSPRYVTPDCAAWIIDRLPANARTVGVFVDCPLDRLLRTVEQCRLDVIQLHGDESAATARELGVERVWKALPVWNEEDLEHALEFPAAAILVDSMTREQRGGTGTTGDWALAARLARKRNIVMAGGLNPANVAGAVQQVKPFAVDVCSGIEKKPGLKNYGRLTQFVHNVRDAVK